MIPKIKPIVQAFIAVLCFTTLADAQDQSAKLILNGGQIASVRLLDSTRLENARIKSDYIQLQQNFLLTDSAGLEIVLSDSCLLSTELDISLEFSADTFLYHLMGYDILDSDEMVIVHSSLAVGDTLVFARSDQYIYLIHNHIVVDYFEYSNTDTILRTALKVNGANNCHLGIKVKQVVIPPVDTSIFEFLDTLLIVNEGDTIYPELVRTNGSTNATLDIALITDSSAHFNNYLTIQKAFTGNDTVNFALGTDPINGMNDENNSYTFELSTQSPYSIIGPRSRLHVVVVDDIQDSLMTICPAGLIIKAVDNEVSDLDRISITNLSPIYPNTSFSISNAVYEKAENRRGRWYAPDSLKSVEIPSQKITYTGSSSLPIGTVICFDIPSTGTGSALFVKDFEIDGTSSSDFTIVNDGNVSDPNISLSTSHPEALFLMQGSWEFNSEFGEFFGTVLHGIQIGSDWLDDGFVNPEYISDKPEEIACFTADWGGSLEIATYYNCDNGYSETSTLTVMSEISQTENWTFEIPTSALDLPTNICQMQCSIEELDTLWYIHVEDLIIPCEDAGNYEDLVNTWLSAHGNGAAFSTCGILSITNNYDSLSRTCGTSTMTEVIFIATDSCSHSFADTGLIIITDTIAPIWTTAPEPLSLFCIDSVIADSLINDWLADFGGGLVFDACNEVVVSHDYTPQQLICDSVLSVTFTATDDCGNQQTAQSFIEIQDDVPPVFINYPQDLFLFCDQVTDLQDTINDWLGIFGYATAMDECSNVTSYLLTPPGLDSLDCPVDTSIMVSFFIRDDCYNYDKADAYIHIKSSTDPCDSTILVEQDSNILVVKDFSCAGVQFLKWEYQATGDSSWTFISVTQDTVFPPVLGQGTYRVTTSCHGVCPDTFEIYYPVCDSLSMMIEDSAIGIKWGELYYGSQPVSNYLISWVNEAGEEVFRSAAGSYYNDSTTLPHPVPAFQPLIPGKYFAKVLSSDYGTGLTCFDSMTVDPLICGNEYVFDYYGSGGSIAKHHTRFTVGDTTILKFWFETANNNPDKLTVVYMGDTIFSTGLVQWNTPRFRTVQIPFISGFNDVDILVENEGNPAHETKYVMKIKCCDEILNCDSIPINPVTISNVQTSGISCNAYIEFDSTWTYDYFWDHYCMDLNSLNIPSAVTTRPGYYSCGFANVTADDSCRSSVSNIVISNLATKGYTSGAGFVLDFPSDLNEVYSNVKSWLSNYQDSALHQIYLTLKKYNCMDDQTGLTILTISPFAGISTFSDVNHEITFVFYEENPFDSISATCTGSNYNLYNLFLYNSSSSYFSSDYETISYHAVRKATETYNNPINGVASKSFSTPTCNTSLLYQFTSHDSSCPCDTWVLLQDTTPTSSSTGYDFVSDDSGSDTCVGAPRLLETTPEISLLPDEYFKIYPNPTRGILIVDFNNPISEDVTITVLDLNGRLIKRQDYSAQRGFNSTEIDMNDIPAGMYILNLHGQNQNNADRFILMR